MKEDDTVPRKSRNKSHIHSEDMRKHVLVDSKGIPYGTMKKVLEQEMQLLTKDLGNGNPNMRRIASSSGYMQVWSLHCM